MTKTTVQRVVGLLLIAAGIWLFTNPGYGDLLETLMDPEKPLAYALPAAFMVAGAYLVATSPRFAVITVAATALIASVIGSALWLFGPAAEFVEGGIAAVPEGIQAGLLAGAVCAVLAGIGSAARMLTSGRRRLEDVSTGT